MNLRFIFVCLVFACSVDHTGLQQNDAGPGVDAGPDGGPGIDSGPGVDTGPGFDSGPALDGGGPDVPGVDGGPPMDVPVIPDAGPDVFDGGTDAGPPPVLTSATYEVVARGGATQISGENLSGLVSASVAGVPVTIEGLTDDGFRIRIADEVPVGPTDLVVSDGTRDALYPLTVVLLVVNEVDEETNSGPDNRQIAEVATYVEEALDLEGYTLVLFDGGDNRAYFSVELGTTSSSGFFVIGNNGVANVDFQISDELIRSGRMAVAIYQSSGFDENGIPVADGLIDAVVYSTNEEPDFELAPALLVEGGRFSVFEESAGNRRGHSLQRCAPIRRDNRGWRPATPTPGAPNNCPSAVVP